MNLEQTKKLVSHFFEATDEGAAMATFKPDQESQAWLNENGYLLKTYGDIYCIAKSEEEFPTEERVVEIQEEMEERRSKANIALMKEQCRNIWLLLHGFGERIR